MYVITGAAGNIGKRISLRLLSEGKKIRVMGRNAERLKPLIDLGAEPYIGQLEDQAYILEVFAGAKAAYTMIPPILHAEDLREYQKQLSDNVAIALEKAGIKYAVNLSSLGAHLSVGTGIILGSYDLEQRLNRIHDLNVVHLRPSYFMENFLGSIRSIKNEGVFGSSLRGDIPIPIVATRDIAKVGVNYLLNLNFEGKNVHDLLGERDLTMVEVTRILAKAVGKPHVKYVQFPYQKVKGSMIRRGISPSVAEASIELSKKLNENPAIFDSERTSEKTTETSIEDFAKLFVDVYQKS